MGVGLPAGRNFIAILRSRVYENEAMLERAGLRGGDNSTRGEASIDESEELRSRSSAQGGTRGGRHA